MATSFGGAVKLTGESEYRKALKNITQNLKEVTSELKLVTSQYGKNDTSIEALSAKSEVLNKRLEAQKEKVSVLKQQYDAMLAAYEKNAAETEALSRQYEEEKKKLSELESALGKTSTEYKAQADKVNDLATELKRAETSEEANAKALSDMRIQLNNAEGDVAKTSREIKDLDKQMTDGAKSADDLGDAVEDAGESADKATGGFTVFKGALASLIANVVSSAVSKMKELISNTIEVGQTFQSSMAKVQAISGATDEDLQLLTDTAKQFGSTTKFSASESADALGYMALAGWDAKTSAEALGGVLNLASASGMDLAKASDMVTDYLSAFGLEANKSAYFADLLAYAQGNANTSAEQLGEAYRNCAANLSSAGQDIETTTALLSMLANQGLKGSEAGTALNAVVRDMTKKMTDGKIAIGDTLIEVQDAEGNFRDLTEILKEVESATNGMGTAEKASALQATFTADSIKGLNLILNAGTQNAEDFEKALRESTGTADNMAKVMNNTLTGNMTALKSQIEGVQITLYEKFEPALRKGVEVLSKLVDGVSWVIDHSDTIVTSLKAIAAAVGTYIAYSTALKVMKDGWQALTIVTKAQTLAQTALNLAMTANPIGLIIAAVAALVVAFVALWNKSEAFRNFFINMWENIKEVVNSAWEKITGFFTTAWDGVTTLWAGLTDFFSGIWDKIKGVFGSVADWIKTNVFEPVMKFFEPVIEFYRTAFEIIGQLASGLWELIKAVWGIVSDWFNENVITPVNEFFTKMWDGIKENAGAAWETIKAAWTVVSSWFNEHVITPVKTVFTGMWNGLKDGAKKAWEGVKTAFSPVADWFKDKFKQAWENVKNVFSTGGKIFSGIKEGIESAFKTVVNAIISGINKVVAIPFNAINNTLDKIREVSIAGISPFKGLISRFTVPQIPLLAKGGIVDGATFIAGEDGKEAVIPLERNTGWITKVAQEIAKYLNVALQGVSTTIKTMQIPQAQTINYDEMVNAFKTALGQMKVVLDDEEVGHFVEKTVADAIYT